MRAASPMADKYALKEHQQEIRIATITIQTYFVSNNH